MQDWSRCQRELYLVICISRRLVFLKFIFVCHDHVIGTLFYVVSSPQYGLHLTEIDSTDEGSWLLLGYAGMGYLLGRDGHKQGRRKHC